MRNASLQRTGTPDHSRPHCFLRSAVTRRLRGLGKCAYATGTGLTAPPLILDTHVEFAGPPAFMQD